MNNNDELAMQAESIIADMKLKHRQNDFYAPVMTWGEFSILLAERDADKKRMVELEREKETMTAAALAMRDDMRDARSLLEARTVSVKLPDRSDEMFWSYTGDFKDEKYQTAVIVALTEAGIKTELEE